jgi:hypothetical protein
MKKTGHSIENQSSTEHRRTLYDIDIMSLLPTCHFLFYFFRNQMAGPPPPHVMPPPWKGPATLIRNAGNEANSSFFGSFQADNSTKGL